MKTLLILRHAKSSWDNPALHDHDRPLNSRGETAAPAMGKLIKKEKIVPQLILTSTALRAKSTAALVAEYCGYRDAVQEHPDLYGADVSDILGILRGIDDKHACVMIVGHNPTLESLVAQLSGQYELFPTAALARIELPIKNWNALDSKIKGQLLGLWRPKEL